jgi:hypothetical protein
MILLALATACAGTFFGAAIYINFVEHPARMSCGQDLAVREFGPSYARASVMQGALNKPLLAPSLDRASETAGTLLARWNRLHAVRSLLSGIAFALLLYRLISIGAV